MQDSIAHIYKRISDIYFICNIDYLYLYMDCYILEKNMDCDATIIGSRQMEIPIKALATQRVTALQTEGVQPLQKDQITRRVKREIVEIY